jgi:hypothetical protein
MDCLQMHKTKPLMTSLLITMLILVQNVFPSDSKQKNSSTGIVIGSVIGTAAVGTAALFLIRYIKRDRLHGDSVISQVNISLDSSSFYYLNDDYLKSEKNLNKVIPLWEEYSKYCKKCHVSQKFTKDSLTEKITNCKLLQSLAERMSFLDSLVLSIPGNAEDLTSKNRHYVNAIIKSAKEDIQHLEDENRNSLAVIHHGLRKSLLHLKKVDSLFSAIYESEQLNFNMKCKYYYNRAVEAKDTLAIQQFIGDCEYYRTDKEWCGRARQILEVPAITQNISVSTKNVNKRSQSTAQKLSAVDSMHNAYRAAIESRSIDLLQKYISKYAKRKFKKKEIRIDSALTVLNTLQTEQQKEMSFNKAYPLFSRDNASELQVIVKGISEKYSNLFKDAVDSIKDEFKSAQGIRFPASVVIDNRGDELQFFLVARANPDKDILFHSHNDTLVYSFTGCLWGAQYLFKLKSRIAQAINAQADTDITFKRMYLNKLNSTVYIMRLKKNDNDYITMYAFDLKNRSAEQPIGFYNFFDISSGNERDLRIVNRDSHEIQFIETSQRDSLKNRLVKSYFWK